jgi:hypothetical protein
MLEAPAFFRMTSLPMLELTFLGAVGARLALATAS